MEHDELIAITFSIFCITLYIASCALSVAFLLMHRKDRWRWLPCVSMISLPLLQFTPESGWSDVQSQWHHAALDAVWSLWVLYLAFVLLRSGKDRVLIALRGLLDRPDLWHPFGPDGSRGGGRRPPVDQR